MTGHGNVVFSQQEADNLLEDTLLEEDFYILMIIMGWTHLSDQK